MSLILPKKFFDLLPINCSWNEFWFLYINIYNDTDLDNDDLDGFLTICKKRIDINQSFDIFMNVVIQLIDMNININPQIINHIIIKLKPFYNISNILNNDLYHIIGEYLFSRKYKLKDWIINLNNGLNNFNTEYFSYLAKNNSDKALDVIESMVNILLEQDLGWNLLSSNTNPRAIKILSDNWIRLTRKPNLMYILSRLLENENAIDLILEKISYLSKLPYFMECLSKNISDRSIEFIEENWSKFITLNEAQIRISLINLANNKNSLAIDLIEEKWEDIKSYVSYEFFINLSKNHNQNAISLLCQKLNTETIEVNSYRYIYNNLASNPNDQILDYVIENWGIVEKNIIFWQYLCKNTNERAVKLLEDNYQKFLNPNYINGDILINLTHNTNDRAIEFIKTHWEFLSSNPYGITEQSNGLFSNYIFGEYIPNVLVEYLASNPNDKAIDLLIEKFLTQEILNSNLTNQDYYRNSHFLSNKFLQNLAQNCNDKAIDLFIANWNFLIINNPMINAKIFKNFLQNKNLKVIKILNDNLEYLLSTDYFWSLLTKNNLLYEYSLGLIEKYWNNIQKNREFCSVFFERNDIYEIDTHDDKYFMKQNKLKQFISQVQSSIY
jgi:hypothetical protein